MCCLMIHSSSFVRIALRRTWGGNFMQFPSEVQSLIYSGLEWSFFFLGLNNTLQRPEFPFEQRNTIPLITTPENTAPFGSFTMSFFLPPFDMHKCNAVSWHRCQLSILCTETNSLMSLLHDSLYRWGTMHKQHRSGPIQRNTHMQQIKKKKTCGALI